MSTKREIFIAFLEIIYSIFGFGILRWKNEYYKKITIFLRLLQFASIFHLCLNLTYVLTVENILRGKVPAFINYMIFILSTLVLLLATINGCELKKNYITSYDDELASIDIILTKYNVIVNQDKFIYIHMTNFIIVFSIFFRLVVIAIFQPVMFISFGRVTWLLAVAFFMKVMYLDRLYKIYLRFKAINELCLKVKDSQNSLSQQIILIKTLRKLHQETSVLCRKMMENLTPIIFLLRIALEFLLSCTFLSLVYGRIKKNETLEIIQFEKSIMHLMNMVSFTSICILATTVSNEVILNCS